MREFAAHSDNVNSVCLGPRTGQYVATAGADKHVHLWTLEKPNCLASYSGHTTPVVSVQMSLMEEHICAGAQGGAIKMYDIGSSKVSRTLMGHRAAIRSIEFHPEGTMLLSSSADSIIKLWDIRKRGSILSCKGHSMAINAIKFSSNGSWFASASDDHKIKIWELRKGQIMHEFTDHSAAVTSLVFHPHSLKLCSCSADGDLKFFDLHKFIALSSTTISAKRRPPISRLFPYSQGNSVLGASEDQLLVYGWENPEPFDHVNVFWGKIQDMKLSGRTLVGASTKRTIVSLYSVNLERTKTSLSINDPLSCGDGYFVGQDACANSIKTVDSTNNNTEACQCTVFKPSRMLPRTPPASARHVLRSQDVCMVKNELAGCNCGMQINLNNNFTEVHHVISKPSSKLDTIEEVSVTEEKSQVSLSVELPTHDSSPPEKTNEAPTVSPSKDLSPEPKNLPSLPKDEITTEEYTKDAKSAVVSEPEPIDLSAKPDCPPVVLPPPVIPPVKTVVAPRKHTAQKDLPSSTRKVIKQDFGVKIFHPEKPIDSSSKPPPLEPEKPEELSSDSVVTLTPITCVGSESEMIGTISREHPLVLTALRNRQKSLRELFQVWKTKNVKASSEMAIKLNDLTTASDFISILVLQPPRWTLDLCVILLPTITKLLRSRHEYHVTTGCDAVRRIIKNFGTLIKSNVANPVETLGVDLCQEERYQKCLNCHDHLCYIRDLIESKQNIRGKISSMLQELNEPLGSALV